MPVDPLTGGAEYLREVCRGQGLALEAGTPTAAEEGKPRDLLYVADIMFDACQAAQAPAPGP